MAILQCAYTYTISSWTPFWSKSELVAYAYAKKKKILPSKLTWDRQPFAWNSFSSVCYLVDLAIVCHALSILVPQHGYNIASKQFAFKILTTNDNDVPSEVWSHFSLIRNQPIFVLLNVQWNIYLDICIWFVPHSLEHISAWSFQESSCKQAYIPRLWKSLVHFIP